MNNRDLYTIMPSPLGEHWREYIHFRMRMLQRALNVYGTEKYSRLNLDRHIRTNRAIDIMCAKLVDYRSAIVYFGASETSPNSPIKIKNHVRTPGARKIIAGFKKRKNVFVIPTNEDYTSQTCGECLSRFHPSTRSHRFKVCQNCHPNESAMLPSRIVSQFGKRHLRLRRKLYRFNAIRNLPNSEDLMSKAIHYRKNWQLNAVAHGSQNADDSNSASDRYEQKIVKKTVWHRDIVAAKCILIKGMLSYSKRNEKQCFQIECYISGHCHLFDIPIHPVFKREQSQSS